MSHAVSPQDLAAAADPYGCTPFLLYVGSSGSVRLNHVTVTFPDDVGHVTVKGYGRGVTKTLTADMTLSLLWPPHTPDGFSLIADGTATVEGSGDNEVLTLTVTGAVLHRPAPTNGEGSC